MTYSVVMKVSRSVISELLWFGLLTVRSGTLLFNPFQHSHQTFKEFVHPLRPAVAAHAPVQRYETKPGQQLQFDWGEFVYEDEGEMRHFRLFSDALCHVCQTL